MVDKNNRRSKLVTVTPPLYQSNDYHVGFNHIKQIYIPNMKRQIQFLIYVLLIVVILVEIYTWVTILDVGCALSRS